MATGVLELGSELAGYRIERPVAEGGMGVVYQATQLSLDRPVALKLISERSAPTSASASASADEARAAAAIDHPNILPVYEAGELDDGRLFLAMRLVNGPTSRACCASKARSIRGGGLRPHPGRRRSRCGTRARADSPRCQAGERDARTGDVGWHAFSRLRTRKARREMRPHRPGELLGTSTTWRRSRSTACAGWRADVYSFGCVVYRCLTGAAHTRRETARRR